MRGGLVAAALLACAPAAAQAPAPNPTVNPVMSADLASLPNVKIVYYDVQGRTKSELRKNMDAVKPMGRDGKRWEGYTEFSFQYRLPMYSDGRCLLDQFEMQYEVRVTLPRLAVPERVSASVRKDWDYFIEGLTLHEKGHVALALRFAETLPPLVKASTCETFQEVIKRENDRLDQAGVEYDRLTNHGINQGTRF